jgi:hypothetical protein
VLAKQADGLHAAVLRMIDQPSAQPGPRASRSAHAVASPVIEGVAILIAMMS